jgi:Rrf2 family iron-sulfur cluster assembly transcriptional regulator
MTHELWASLNQRMVEFLDSVTLQKLVDEQLAKGVQIEDKPIGQAGAFHHAGGQADPRECPELGVCLGNAFAKS